jgi:hypothetical protein
MTKREYLAFLAVFVLFALVCLVWSVTGFREIIREKLWLSHDRQIQRIKEQLEIPDEVVEWAIECNDPVSLACEGPVPLSYTGDGVVVIMGEVQALNGHWTGEVEEIETDLTGVDIMATGTSDWGNSMSANGYETTRPRVVLKIAEQPAELLHTYAKADLGMRGIYPVTSRGSTSRFEDEGGHWERSLEFYFVTEEESIALSPLGYDSKDRWTSFGTAIGGLILFVLTLAVVVYGVPHGRELRKA